MKKFVFVFLFLVQFAHAQEFTSIIGDIPVGPVQKSGAVQVPYITWGGDVPTFLANGGLKTTSNSIFAKSGLNINLVAGDDFEQQVKDYVSGKSPYLRGTFHMFGLASEVINKDPKTKPVVFMQLTWSLGDHIVARGTVKNLAALKGKKICLKKDGPHTGLLDDSLQSAGLSWDDVTIVWAKNLTGPDSPAEMMRNDASIDAVCVITPDMIGLTSGLESTGGQGEGNIEGAHVVNSTAYMSRSIADVYAVRSDYYESNKDSVEKFFVGYLKATEDIIKFKEAYNNGRGSSPEYIQVLKLSQSIFGESVLPTIEEDAHGLISDANFVRIPGNEIFFEDPNNLTGFDALQKNALSLSEKLGFIKSKTSFTKSNWDYKQISTKVGVNYVAPVYSKNRIKAEVTDFNIDLDDSEILSFAINFDPETNEFTVEKYKEDFERYCKISSLFPNAAVVIEGHSDPTLVLQHFYWAAKAKGLITGGSANMKFRNQPMSLTDTDSVITAIESENFSGLKRKNSRGEVEDIPDPKTTAAATLTLSLARAKSVKSAIERFSKSNGYQVDMSQAIPKGVGIASPVIPRPKNMEEAKQNMRVLFRVVKTRSEIVSPNDFDFDK